MESSEEMERTAEGHESGFIAHVDALRTRMTDRDGLLIESAVEEALAISAHLLEANLRLNEILIELREAVESSTPT